MVSLGAPFIVDARAATPASRTDPIETASSAGRPAEPDTQGNLGRPYNLPAASRARMHQCGIEWQALKMSGGAVEKTWRNFAAVCLATGDKDKAGAEKK
jgi:hypothetical protein